MDIRRVVIWIILGLAVSDIVGLIDVPTWGSATMFAVAMLILANTVADKRKRSDG